MNEEDMMNASSSGEAEAGPSTFPQQADTERPEGMSKNAMKRAAKQARMEALKPIKRAAEKQRRKERSNELSQGYKMGTLSEKDIEIYERRKKLEKERKISKKLQKLEDDAGNGIDKGKGNDNLWKGGIVIDLGFDDLMNEQEISSMASQIGYCYSINRIAPKPIKTIIHTSFSPSSSPRLWNKMIDRNWNRWSRSYWWDQSVKDLNEVLSGDANQSLVKPSSILEGDHQQSTSLTNDGPIDNFTATDKEAGAANDLESFLSGPNLPPGIEKGKHKLVYLSADAEDELTTLSDDEVYIIGGIVDRNRYKNLCQNKAEILDIRTARLPIGKFIENLPTRKVLTVNQVLDILIQYIAQNDWQKAFETVIPQRKFHESKKAKSKSALLNKGKFHDGKKDQEQGDKSIEDNDGVTELADEIEDREEDVVEEESLMNQ